MNICRILTHHIFLTLILIFSHFAYSQSPNIILIYADDLGYGDLGCYGHPSIKTPTLDNMAREGVKFSSFYVAASVCTPSRAGLMTGRYPMRIGFPWMLGPDSEGGLPLAEETLADALRKKGYRTAAFGKWHLGAVPGFFPTNRGFDEYYGILYSNDMMPPWVKTDRPLHLYRNDKPTDEYPVDQSTLTQRYADETIRFIRESRGRPFFIYLPFAMPHLPISASAEFRGKSAGGLYGDVIEEIDANIGRILAELKSENIEENTMVIFTSDNGPWRNMPPRMYQTDPVEQWHGGSTGSLRGAKATSYEGGFRVPAIIRWPGHVHAGQVITEWVTTLDLHATIREAAGAAPPARPLDGIDIHDLIRGNSRLPERFFYYFNYANLDGIRNNTWKLLVTWEVRGNGSQLVTRNWRLTPAGPFENPLRPTDVGAAGPLSKVLLGP